MNMPRLAVLTLLLAACAGCNGDPPPPAQSSVPATTPAGVPTGTSATPLPSQGTEVFSKVAPGKGTAVAVLGGQTFSGKYAMERDGAVSAFGIRIGTYYGKADGSLKLKLCANASCQEAELPLVGAKDNDYLVFPMPEAIPVTTGTTLDYTLTRSSDDPTNRVAIWVYPKREDQVGIVDPTGKAIEAVARLSIHIQ